MLSRLIRKKAVVSSGEKLRSCSRTSRRRAGHTPPVEGQRRVCPRNQDQMQLWRGIFDETGEKDKDCILTDQMQVVKHQKNGFVPLTQKIDQNSGQGLDRRRR